MSWSTWLRLHGSPRLSECQSPREYRNMITPDTILRWARRAYRLNLRFLPRQFRAEYGDQMLLDFNDLLQNARSDGVFAVLATIAWSLVDIWVAAVRERW